MKSTFNLLLALVMTMGAVSFAQADSTVVLRPAEDIQSISPAYWSNQKDVQADSVNLQWNSTINGAQGANSLSVTGTSSSDDTINQLLNLPMSQIALIFLDCQTLPSPISAGNIELYVYIAGPGMPCTVTEVVSLN